MLILSFICLLLEGIISFILPLKLVLFSFLFLSSNYKKDKEKYFIIGVFLGLIYDVFYGPFLFFYTFLFSVISLLFSIIKKKFLYKAFFIFLFLEYFLYCLINNQVILNFNFYLGFIIFSNLAMFLIIKNIFSYKIN